MKTAAVPCDTLVSGYVTVHVMLWPGAPAPPSLETVPPAHSADGVSPTPDGSQLKLTFTSESCQAPQLGLQDTVTAAFAVPGITAAAVAATTST
ncbi:MAG TPA: hypothetical protein VN962_08410, partial [Polyangia bacterium]|nr:hypothetical protein [Polyangia bacterium]